MPKYLAGKVAGHYLYFTTKCINDPMHVHAGDSKLNPSTSARFWVLQDGSVEVDKTGDLKRSEIKDIIDFIGENYLDMYATWRNWSSQGFYKENR